MIKEYLEIFLKYAKGFMSFKLECNFQRYEIKVVYLTYVLTTRAQK